MTAVTFDTLKFAETLKHAGFKEEQAVALAKAQQDALSESLTNSTATKADLSELKVDLIKWMVGLSLAQLALLVGILIKIL